MIDSRGLVGFYFHYACLFVMVGSGLVILGILWKKKRLDMDEEPKFTMLEDENE